MAKDVKEVINSINHRDAEARIAEEQALLEEAERLTNGRAGCSVTQGKVMLGLVKKTIEVSSNVRDVIELLPALQTKQACLMYHKKPPSRGFNLPTNITLWGTILSTVGMVGKFAGWW